MIDEEIRHSPAVGNYCCRVGFGSRHSPNNMDNDSTAADVEVEFLDGVFIGLAEVLLHFDLAVGFREVAAQPGATAAEWSGPAFKLIGDRGDEQAVAGGGVRRGIHSQKSDVGASNQSGLCFSKVRLDNHFRR